MQICSFIIGSWQQDLSRIQLRIYSSFSNQSNIIDYTENPLWDLLNASTTIIKSGSRFQNVFYSDDLYFNLTIARQPLYYMINNVYPCLILNMVTLLTFFLPFNLQATLTITTFVNLAIISVRVSSDIPTQSRVLPLISLYFMMSLFYTSISFIWFVVYEQLFTTRKHCCKFIRELNVFIYRETKKQQDEENNNNHTDDLKLINLFAFILMFLLMFSSYTIIWTIIAS